MLTLNTASATLAVKLKLVRPCSVLLEKIKKKNTVKQNKTCRHTNEN
jgi:hypothetical protein